jgi:hypothetical protein
MAEFRKYALAFAGVACFMGITGTASAQSQNSPTCTASAATPLQMRAEGITELAGDVVLSCTGGTVTPAGSPVPTVNITVNLSTQVTSRLIGGSSSPALTDAILLIDEPASGSQNLCAASLSNNYACPNIVLGTGNGGGKAPNFQGNYYGNIPNMYQGVLTSTSSITFYNIPVDAPGSAIFYNNGGTVTPVLTLRITNIRANASALGVNTGFGVSGVTEYISTSTGLSINNPTQTVGSILQGLVLKSVGGVGTSSTQGTTYSFNANSLYYGTSGGAPTLTQCTSKSLSSSSVTSALVEYVNFSEGFATATKLRYAPGIATGAESTPGNTNNVEGGFIPNTSLAYNIGTADFATRVKIVFGSIPAGVTLYVPTTLPSNTLNGGAPTEFMTLTSTTVGAESASFSAVSASSVTNLPTVAPYGGFAALPLTSGSGEAVYEVTTQQAISQNTVESFSVPVLVTFSASPGTGSPGLGTTTVEVDFAPSSTVVTAAASPIPRFITTASFSGFTISTCATNLLFPFVTNQSGYDTGIAIASTSTDPFGTTPQSGTCTLNFYGSGAPAAFTTPTVTSGTVYTTLASNVAPGFQGYMIAQCKFQYGHGFAFAKDGFGGPGQGLSVGYLALIIPDTSIVTRAPNPNVTTAGAGEILSN